MGEFKEHLTRLGIGAILGIIFLTILGYIFTKRIEPLFLAQMFRVSPIFVVVFFMLVIVSIVSIAKMRSQYYREMWNR